MEETAPLTRQEQPPQRKSQFRDFVIAMALILMVLGTGNLFYGSHRVRQSVLLIEKVERNIAKPTRSFIPLTDPTINTDHDQQQLRKLRANLQFYQFVKHAGFWMLFAGILASSMSLLFPLQYSKDHG